MRMTTDEKYMRTALKQAEKAYNLGETPIGCVIVHEDKIIARGYNRRNTDKNPLAHAEVAVSSVMRDSSEMDGFSGSEDKISSVDKEQSEKE